MQNIVFSVFYLPPAAFFAKLMVHQGKISLERHEHFLKQTYYNRAVILGPNGKLNLIIPIQKNSRKHTPIKDVRISYAFNWQRIHWASLRTSYKRAPYFEHYEEDLAPFYEKKFGFLFDFNEALLVFLLKSLKLSITYHYSDLYQPSNAYDIDLRRSIHPKLVSIYRPKPYVQVFGERSTSISGFSIIDLLFSQGPRTKEYL